LWHDRGIAPLGCRREGLRARVGGVVIIGSSGGVEIQQRKAEPEFVTGGASVRHHEMRRAAGRPAHRRPSVPFRRGDSQPGESAPSHGHALPNHAVARRRGWSPTRFRIKKMAASGTIPETAMMTRMKRR
jgi:hypothetical protein